MNKKNNEQDTYISPFCPEVCNCFSRQEKSVSTASMKVKSSLKKQPETGCCPPKKLPVIEDVDLDKLDWWG